MVPVTLFGPIDAILGPAMEYVLLVLVVVNMVTRWVAHRSHVRQAREDGAEAIARLPAHTASNALLVLGSFYYLSLHHHAGIVISVLVLGLFLSDFFEFEARKVEARNELDLEPPKSAIATSVLVLLYAAYLSLFFLIKPVWNAIV